MNFLAPLFLAGAAAIALPVVFHLIRRSTRQTTRFSSLLLLEPSPPRLRRRSRLEDLLLLALRCLALVLLALGFARPYLEDPTFAPPAAAATQRVVLLVDTSASMQRAGLWNDAVEHAQRHAQTLAAGDQLSLVAFGRESRPLVTFDAWKATPADRRAALVASRLRDTGPGWSETRLASALVSAAETLLEHADESPGIQRRIVLVSDLQEGSRLDQLQAYEWPKGITVQVDRIAPARRTGNAGLQLLADSLTPNAASNATVRVRLGNTGDATESNFELGWATPDAAGRFAAPPTRVQVPPGANRVVALAVPPLPNLDRILLVGDADPFDNTAFVVPPLPTRARVLFLGNAPSGDPREPQFFLSRAFPPTNQLGVTLGYHPPANASLPAEPRPALVVAADALPADTAGALRDAVREGATLLFVPRAATPETGTTLAALLGHTTVSLEEIQARNYAMLGDLDFRHPLLAPFADPRFADFTKIHFWRYRKLDLRGVEGARVIARFDSGDPAWIEIPTGRGRIFVFTSGWQPEDSQLAVSSKFVPLLFSMIEAGGTLLNPSPRAFTVGDIVPLPEPAGPGTAIVLPDRTAVELPVGATNFAQALRPGIYGIRRSGSTNLVRFAVNLDAAESRTAPLPLDQLESLGLTLREPANELPRTPERLAELAAAEVENRQKLWRWVLLVTLAALFLESALAGWISRRLAPGPAPGASSPNSTAAAA